MESVSHVRRVGKGRRIPCGSGVGGSRLVALACVDDHPDDGDDGDDDDDDNHAEEKGVSYMKVFFYTSEKNRRESNSINKKQTILGEKRRVQSHEIN
jgi:hypothetical protein